MPLFIDFLVVCQLIFSLKSDRLGNAFALGENDLKFHHLQKENEGQTNELFKTIAKA